jgi:hypothetical protein
MRMKAGGLKAGDKFLWKRKPGHIVSVREIVEGSDSVQLTLFVEANKNTIHPIFKKNYGVKIVPADPKIIDLAVSRNAFDADARTIAENAPLSTVVRCPYCNDPVITHGQSSPDCPSNAR